MIALHPVLEVQPADGFDLWPTPPSPRPHPGTPPPSARSWP
ncbi:hypothetical protein ACFQ8W_12235 [Streptomyces sp. NPDC056508]